MWPKTARSANPGKGTEPEVRVLHGARSRCLYMLRSEPGQAIIRSRRRHSVIRNLHASLLRVLGLLCVIGSACARCVLCSFQEQRRRRLRHPMIRASQDGLLQVPLFVVSDGYRLCSLDVFASFQGKRRSRRRHSGLKTLEASRLQVSFCRCVMGRTCVRFLFV